MSTDMKAIQGGTRLLFDVIQGITNTVEQMHKTAAQASLSLEGSTPKTNQSDGAVAARVYNTIRAVNGGLREGLDRSFGLLPKDSGQSSESNASTRMTAALNGFVGDHLEDTGNVLATSMTLRTPELVLDLDPAALSATLPEATGHLVVLVHGLGLSELSWRRKDQPDIGSHLRQDLGYTPLYLRYNTGRHVSSNGQQLAQMLDQLCAGWSVPVQSVSLIGHSMGGLVLRSACCYAERNDAAWLQQLQRVVCLGTPHHGAPLEKFQHMFESLMQKVPHADPYLFGKVRSVGIKDLRHGALLDEDWQGHGPEGPSKDVRQVVPLVQGVEHHFVAASIGQNAHDPLGQLLGDLLVRQGSAVGSHADELRKLTIKPENCRVFHDCNHFDLLDDQQVLALVLRWFAK